MAIAFDSMGGTGSGTSATTLNWTQVVASSPTSILVVGVTGNLVGSGSVLTSVTALKGGSTTNLTAFASSPFSNNNVGRFMYVYYMLSPDSGTNTITLNNSTTGFLAGFSVTYTGVRQSGIPDNSAANVLTTGTTASDSLTPVAANSWVISYVLEGVGSTITAGSGTTLRTTTSNTAFFDTNAGVSTGTTLNYASGNASSTWGDQIFSLAPAAATTSGSFLAFM